MKILLVVPSLNLPSFKGLARYSLGLVEGLEKIVDLEVYEVHNPTVNYLKNLTIVPFKQLTNKADICHVITPESGAIAFLKRRNTIVTFHDLMPLNLEEVLNFKNKGLLKIYVTLTWNLSARAETIICNSTQTAKELKYYFNRNSVVINPYIDKKFNPIYIKKKKPTLGFFANFSERKRVNIAIDVFKILKHNVDCKLILAGGNLNSMFQKNINIENMINGLSDIEVLGYINEEKIVELYNSFDFFLFPSLFEGFGIPILESQKCGIPTLIMNDARIPQETQKIAIKCNSRKDMAEKIIYLINNKDKYRKISEEGICYANKFTFNRFIKEHLAIYKRIYARDFI